MAKSSRFKKFVIRYAWTGPVLGVLGFILGIILGPGSLWQELDLKVKNHQANIAEHQVSLADIQLEKDIYERQQVLLQQIADDMITYVNLRDSYFGSPYYEANNDYVAESPVFAAGTNPSLIAKGKDELALLNTKMESFGELRIRFLLQKTKLVSLITEYNELELKNALVEKRPASWFDLKTIPPVPPFTAVDPSAYRVTNTSVQPSTPIDTNGFIILDTNFFVAQYLTNAGVNTVVLGDKRIKMTDTNVPVYMYHLKVRNVPEPATLEAYSNVENIIQRYRQR